MLMGPISRIASVFSPDPSLLRPPTHGVDEGQPLDPEATPASMMDDDQVDPGEFQMILKRIMMGVSGEEVSDEGGGPRLNALASAMSPMLFNYFDADGNGMIEGEEVEQLRGVLETFNPEILAYVGDAEGEEAQEDEHGGEALPDVQPRPTRVGNAHSPAPVSVATGAYLPIGDASASPRR